MCFLHHRAKPDEIYKPLKSLAHLEGESSNTLFEVLAEWERHLTQLDRSGQGVRDENPRP